MANGRLGGSWRIICSNTIFIKKMTKSVINIGNSDSAIKYTTKVMKEFALRDSKEPEIIDLAKSIQENAKNNYVQTAIDLAKWVADNIEYTYDHKNIINHFDKSEYVTAEQTEFLMRPIRLLNEGKRKGDCDDMSTLFASLCIVLGYPVNFKIIAWESDQYDHVYNEIGLFAEKTEGLTEDVFTPVDTVYMSVFNGEFGQEKVNKPNRYFIEKVN